MKNTVILNPIKIVIFLVTATLIISCSKKKSDYHVISKVPDLIMPENHLKFKTIENYKNYRIVATHYRTDKNELRYILANNLAFKALNEKQPLPNGSIFVKIGWNVKQMPNFNAALEANNLQRIEYMIKDNKKFETNPGNWGYARFINNNGKYESWKKGTSSCISCHNLAKDNDFIFTKLQNLQ